MEADVIFDKKWEFVEKRILQDSIIASLQRSKTYNDKADDPRKKKLRKKFSNLLVSKKKYYVDPGTVHNLEELHIQNIISISENISESYGHILYKEEFRISSVQKGLNLYLKYLWCLEEIDEPPHCPIDATIMNQIDMDKSWTEINDINVYKEIISQVRKEAREKNKSIAEWELELWNKED